PGRGPGPDFLASQGLDIVAAGRAVHALCVSRQWLSRGQGTTNPGFVALEENRSLGQLRRKHVHDRIRESCLWLETHELPWACADFQCGLAFLSRTAHTLW